MKIAQALVIIVAVISLGGCAYQRPVNRTGTGATLVNTYWKLILADGVEIDTPTDTREAHIILRRDHRVAGYAGCNAFSSSWEIKGGQLIVGPFMSTRIGCPDRIAEQMMRSVFRGEVTTYISGNTLTVTSHDGTELQFRAMYFN